MLIQVNAAQERMVNGCMRRMWQGLVSQQNMCTGAYTGLLLGNHWYMHVQQLHLDLLMKNTFNNYLQPHHSLSEQITAYMGPALAATRISCRKGMKNHLITNLKQRSCSLKILIAGGTNNSASNSSTTYSEFALTRSKTTSPCSIV